ncbi:hypothetical protein E2C01_083044 [Portunus trituberculatus]|uniref:Uncharacterized protein n=1 Tax=Portunus trituberculatus TaxID=210409 RepID=A0A5B7ITW0_PORTR|nr:hypothetical protein [Portunus trituberculatus]
MNLLATLESETKEELTESRRRGSRHLEVEVNETKRAAWEEEKEEKEKEEEEEEEEKEEEVCMSD